MPRSGAYTLYVQRLCVPQDFIPSVLVRAKVIELDDGVGCNHRSRLVAPRTVQTSGTDRPKSVTRLKT